jgi:hypothetical protein
MYGRGEKSVHGFGAKAQRKETTHETEAYMRGWDQKVSWGDWLGDCGVDPNGSE